VIRRDEPYPSARERGGDKKGPMLGKKFHDDTAIVQSCDTGFRGSRDLMH